MAMDECSNCHKKKQMYHGFSGELHNVEVHYCKECYQYLYEKVKCDVCRIEVLRKDLVKHKSDMHTN